MTVRPFTGWHMTALLCVFFGVVIGVNLLMATDAMRTFSGTVVENSYVASQRYNAWLESGRRQKALGWTAPVSIGPDQHLAVWPAAHGVALSNVTIVAVATHPLGRVASRALGFTRLPDGRYRANEILPHGRWLLRIDMRGPGGEAHFDDEVHA